MLGIIAGHIQDSILFSNLNITETAMTGFSNKYYKQTT
jgi:hypothetical protein